MRSILGLATIGLFATAWGQVDRAKTLVRHPMTVAGITRWLELLETGDPDAKHVLFQDADKRWQEAEAYLGSFPGQIETVRFTPRLFAQLEAGLRSDNAVLRADAFKVLRNTCFQEGTGGALGYPEDVFYCGTTGGTSPGDKAMKLLRTFAVERPNEIRPLLSSNDPQLLSLAVDLLGTIDPAAVQATLESAMESPDEEIQFVAIGRLIPFTLDRDHYNRMLPLSKRWSPAARWTFARFFSADPALYGWLVAQPWTSLPTTVRLNLCWDRLHPLPRELQIAGANDTDPDIAIAALAHFTIEDNDSLRRGLRRAIESGHMGDDFRGLAREMAKQIGARKVFDLASHASRSQRADLAFMLTGQGANPDLIPDALSLADALSSAPSTGADSTAISAWEPHIGTLLKSKNGYARRFGAEFVLRNPEGRANRHFEMLAKAPEQSLRELLFDTRFSPEQELAKYRRVLPICSPTFQFRQIMRLAGARTGFARQMLREYASSADPTRAELARAWLSVLP